MKLTTKGRYAVTAMLDLCCQEASVPVSLMDIAKRQEISLSYLEQLFAKLRRRGLVRSVRGPGGGYLLMASPSTISVADIIRAVDEPIQATSCDESDPEGCRRSTRCITHHLWERVGLHLNQYLDSIHLGSLIEEIRVTGVIGTDPGGKL
ncbi:MAG: Rrf2 family transcriptional regulator [Magnetococcales bacterium]|nr:Rrf2 family transcriptional regulator [Magnetococcales bacterium]MBF0439389.1 Rrf2 family transcriptional regulator [Magnetococcales bacterium]